MSDILSTNNKYVSSGLLCLLLTSCGEGNEKNGGNSRDITENNVQVTSSTELTGVSTISSNTTVNNNNQVTDLTDLAEVTRSLRIDENNYERVFSASVVRTVDINVDLQDYFNSVNPASLSLLSVNGNVSTYRCNNLNGTVHVTPISSNTEEYLFTNCDLPRNFPAYRYNNTLRAQLISSSGEVASFPELQRSWSKTQVFTMTNLNLSPVSGQTGSVDILNGSVTFLQSNDARSLLHNTKITSSNLGYERTSLSGVRSVINYRFFSYDDLDNNNDASADIEINFNASVAGIGDIVVITNPVLGFSSFESSLEGGALLLKNSASTVIFQARGGDRVDVLLDPENDGSFEQAIPADWSHLDRVL